METIVITGASRGIGKALTEEFLRQGWRVFAGMRKPKEVNLAIQSSAAFLNVIPLDVNSDEAVAAAVKTVRKAGEIQVLVNNAAVFPGEGNERLSDMKLEWFRQAFETNVVAVARVIQHFRPLLSSGSRIVNISSGAASISSKDDFNYYAYSVSKAALNMLTRTVAAEFATDGIAVVAISPGWVRTEMGGPNAPLSPEESAQSLFQTITRLNMDHSSSFMGRDGLSDEYQW